MHQRVAEFIRIGLQQYDQDPQNIEAYSENIDSPREFLFWMQTLEIGKMTARTNLQWIENVIKQIHNGEIPEA